MCSYIVRVKETKEVLFTLPWFCFKRKCRKKRYVEYPEEILTITEAERQARYDRGII